MMKHQNEGASKSNRITTGRKRVGKVSRDKTKAKESILEGDLAKK